MNLPMWAPYTGTLDSRDVTDVLASDHLSAATRPRAVHKSAMNARMLLYTENSASVRHAFVIKHPCCYCCWSWTMAGAVATNCKC